MPRSHRLGGKRRAGARKALERRDGPDCHWCGALEAGRTIDHVHARAFGGSNHLSNLVLACEACNQRRGAVDALGLSGETTT